MRDKDTILLEAAYGSSSNPSKQYLQGDHVWYTNDDGEDYEAKITAVTGSNEYMITVAGHEIRVSGEELHQEEIPQDVYKSSRNTNRTFRQNVFNLTNVNPKKAYTVTKLNNLVMDIYNIEFKNLEDAEEYVKKVKFHNPGKEGLINMSPYDSPSGRSAVEVRRPNAI